MPIAKTQSTALHLSAYGGHSEVAKILINCGASVLTQNKFGDTVFHIAIRHGQVDFMKQILEYIEEHKDTIFIEEDSKKNLYDTENA